MPDRRSRKGCGQAAVVALLVLTAFRLSAQKLLQAPFVVATGTNAGNKVTVLDGAVEKYNGVYYLFGFGQSPGMVYSSTDLINWGTPVSWLSTNPATFPSWVSDPYYNSSSNNGYDADTYPRFGAGDMFFHNGVMFWCFNTMAFAGFNPATLNDPIPVGAQYSLNNPYSRGIDGQFFISRAGEVLYIRKANPNEPQRGMGTGSVWVFNLGNSFFNEPFSTELNNPGFGTQLLSGETGRWDDLDFRNFEGPELYYHHGQYYLLYVGNKLDPETGLYETGVAQDNQWTNLSNADKYPGKLISRNLEKFILKYKGILPTAEHGSTGNYQYTFTAPPIGWQNSLDANGWSTGEGGFGYPLTILSARVQGLWNAGATNPANIWSSPSGPQTIWARRSFTLDSSSIVNTLALRYRLAGQGTSGKIYVNGNLVVTGSGYSPSYSMTPIPASFLRVGTNVVAATVMANASTLQNFLDFGVYDTRGKPVEPDIVGPAQPNLIEGPNGFEIWALYKGLWNGNNGQGKSRVYFWKNQELVVDGPYSGASVNFPLEPAPPLCHESFTTAASTNHFDALPSVVSWNSNALYFNCGSAIAQALVVGLTNQNVFLEAGFKFATNPGTLGRAGMVAWQTDASNWARVYLERASQNVVVDYSFGGTNGSASFPLPSTFAYIATDSRAAGYGEQYHTLKVYKNGARVFAQVDHYWVNNDQPLLVRNELLVPGRVGLVANQSFNWADSLTVSPGWEEYGTNINGWSGAWSVTTNGIVSPASGQQFATKGDATLAHEFSGYLDTGILPVAGKAGLIAEQIDNNNYVSVAVNYSNRMLELTAVAGGQARLLGATHAWRDTIYGYTNFIGASQTQYVYSLRGTVALSQVRALWTYGYYDPVGLTYLLPNFSLPGFGFDVWSNGAWQSQPFTYVNNGRGQFGDAFFSTETVTTQVRLRVPATINRPFAFAVREEISSQNFLRVLRQAGRIYVWANHELLFDVADPFAGQPARVGLFAQDCATTFQNLTCFQIPTVGQPPPATPNEFSVPWPGPNYLFSGAAGMPYGFVTNVSGVPRFALSFYRRTDDDSLNYQVLNLNNSLQATSVAWTDALPYTNAVPVNATFEKVTYVYPAAMPSQSAAFLQVKVTRR